jgi:hypothetical protein
MNTRGAHEIRSRTMLTLFVLVGLTAFCLVLAWGGTSHGVLILSKNRYAGIVKPGVVLPYRFSVWNLSGTDVHVILLPPCACTSTDVSAAAIRPYSNRSILVSVHVGAKWRGKETKTVLLGFHSGTADWIDRSAITFDVEKR